MDFKDAVRAHAEWKLSFARYLKKPDGTMDPRDIVRERESSLGRWLYESGKRYSEVPEFSELMTVHSRFHIAAADLVVRANRGENVSEELAMGSPSEYAKISRSIVIALMRIQNKIGR